VENPREDIMNKDKYATMLGVGDFFYYNLMVLFLLSPLPPMTSKICVAIGGIICIQVGYMATIWIAALWNVENSVPGIPLPVVTYSIYAVFVDIFMEYSKLDACSYIELISQ